MVFEHQPPPPAPTSSTGADRGGDSAKADESSQSAYDLLYDIWSYRSRRQEMIRGGGTTSAELAGFLALERFLRGTRRSENDLRAFQRFNCSIPAVLWFAEDQVAAVQVTNVSADGAAISHQVRLRAGQDIRLRFTLPRPSSLVTFDFQGRVMWVWKQAAGIMYAGGAESTILHDAPDASRPIAPVFQTAPAANDMPTRVELDGAQVQR